VDIFGSFPPHRGGKKRQGDMNDDDEYFLEQEDIYINSGSLGYEPLGRPPKTFMSSFATDPHIKLSDIPSPVSMDEPSTSFLPTGQPIVS